MRQEAREAMPGTTTDTQQLLSHATQLLPDLAAARERIQASSEDVLERAFPSDDPGLEPRAIVVAPGDTAGLSVDGATDAVREERKRLLEAGAQAIDKLEAEGTGAQLDPEEQSGLEAIVLVVARPAILMHEGQFGEAPPPWSQILEPYRPSIETTSPRIGRIEVNGLPQVPYGGTGFLVAEDVVMTNCHVAMLFAHAAADTQWALKPGVGSSIAFLDEPDLRKPTDPLPGFDVTEVIGIHDKLDLALLRVEPQADGGALAEPLTLMSQDPGPLEGRRIYVLGYPAPDWRNDQAVQRAIFGDRYFVKRLQPGTVMPTPQAAAVRFSPCSDGATPEDVLFHDASTLGGNSGSAVIDLDTNQVIGLHFAGSYLEYNQAVALWRLTEDPLLVRAGVNFD
jgi:trypsin-like peptidase